MKHTTPPDKGGHKNRSAANQPSRSVSIAVWPPKNTAEYTPKKGDTILLIQSVSADDPQKAPSSTDNQRKKITVRVYRPE